MKEDKSREDSMEAEDWKRMYMILLHAISDVIEDEPCRSAKAIIELLAEASLRAEDYYISVSDAVAGLPEQEGSWLKAY